MWTAFLALLSRFAQPLLLVALVGAAGLLLKCGLDNSSLKRQLNKANEATAQANTKRIEAENRFDDLVRDYNEQARASAMREAALHEEREAALVQVRQSYEPRIAAVDRSLQLALDSLRHSAAEDRRRALKAAADAPAACRDHAADPTRLSVPHAEFLVREAHRANRAALQLAGCHQYVNEVVKPGVP